MANEIETQVLSNIAEPTVDAINVQDSQKPAKAPAAKRKPKKEGEDEGKQQSPPKRPRPSKQQANNKTNKPDDDANNKNANQDIEIEVAEVDGIEFEDGEKCPATRPFTDVERIWFLYCIGIARDRLDKHKKPTIGMKIYKEVCKVLDELKHIKRPARKPTNKALRSIWTRFMAEGRISKVKASGRKKKGAERERIAALLKNSDLSYRKIAAEVGCSTTLVSCYAKSLQQQEKAATPKKPRKPRTKKEPNIDSSSPAKPV